MKIPPLSMSLLAGVCLLACVSQRAAAAEWQPGSYFVQGGYSFHEVGAVTLGASWPWAWRSQAVGGLFTAQTEASASFWRARDYVGGHQSFTQLALVPLLRYRPDEGRSPWFAEAGIGVSVMDHLYLTPENAFGSRFNFSDNLAVGYSFGQRATQEISLRVQHISNAGIKKPNPGENFFHLRYAIAF